MSRVRTIPILLCLMLTLTTCQPAGPVPEIEAYLDQSAESGFFSGVVLIARDGEPVLEFAYGMADLDHSVSITIETKFNLGSMNKMFTAVAILQLVQAGELSLEDSIGDVLPDYPNQDVSERVTIHHLLTHTSGLGDIFTEDFIQAPKDQFRTLEGYLQLFVDQPLMFDPGSASAYSNAGYLLLGLIIEEISGHTYYEYVRENIFHPCGMMSTDSYQVDEIVEDRAVGYSRHIPGNEGLSTNVTFLPARGSSAGGGYSTAGDLLRFSVCLMDHQLLSADMTEMMMEPQSQLDAASLDFDYGYGIMVQDQNGHAFIGHGGGAPGICSNLDIFTDLGYTVVILTNSDDDCRPARLEIRRILTD